MWLIPVMLLGFDIGLLGVGYAVGNNWFNTDNSPIRFTKMDDIIPPTNPHPIQRQLLANEYGSERLIDFIKSKR